MKLWRRIMKVTIMLLLTAAIGGAMFFAVVNHQANMNKSYSGAKYIDILHKNI